MRPSRWLAVTDLGGRQHGVVSTYQLRTLGCSKEALDRARRAGLLLPYRFGVYEVAGSLPSPFRPLMAACLAGGPFTAASHLAAGWVHGIERIAPGAVELTVYGDCAARLSGVRTHESVFLHEADRSVVAGIPVTSPARTVMDLAAVASAWLLPKLFDDLLRRHLCTAAEVMACVERIGGRGRAGTAFLRVLAQERIDGHHPGDNDWEVRLVRGLVAAGLRPVQQHQVVVGNRVLVIDVAFLPFKVGLEFKGWDTRSVRTGFDHDAERDLLLEGVGWHMLAATSRTRRADVLAAVQSAIECRKATLHRELNGADGGQVALVDGTMRDRHTRGRS